MQISAPVVQCLSVGDSPSFLQSTGRNAFEPETETEQTEPSRGRTACDAESTSMYGLSPSFDCVEGSFSRISGADFFVSVCCEVLSGL